MGAVSCPGNCRGGWKQAFEAAVTRVTYIAGPGRAGGGRNIRLI